MAYKVIVSPSAEKEIEGAIDYYSELSVDAPAKFYIRLKKHTVFYPTIRSLGYATKT